MLKNIQVIPFLGETNQAVYELSIGRRMLAQEPNSEGYSIG